MSETLTNPQPAEFDALAQAKHDANPEVARYHVWVDSTNGLVDPQNAANLVEYLEGRPSYVGEVEPFYSDGQLTPEEGDGLGYENMGMVELARQLGKAEGSDDKTKENDVTDVLMAKMSDFAIKNKLTNEAQEALLVRLMKVKDTALTIEANAQSTAGSAPAETATQPKSTRIEAKGASVIAKDASRPAQKEKQEEAEAADEIELTPEQSRVKALGAELDELAQQRDPEAYTKKIDEYRVAYLDTIAKDADDNTRTKEYEQLISHIQGFVDKYNEVNNAETKDTDSKAQLRDANNLYHDALKRFNEAGDDEDARKKAVHDARVATNTLGRLNGWKEPELDKANKRFSSLFGEPLYNGPDNANVNGDAKDAAPEGDTVTPEEAEANYEKELADLRAQIRDARARGDQKELERLSGLLGTAVRNRGEALGEGHEPDSDWAKQQIADQQELLAKEQAEANEAQQREALEARQQKRSKIGKVAAGLLLVATGFFFGDKYGARHHTTLKDRIEAIQPSSTTTSTTVPKPTVPGGGGTTVSTVKPGAPAVVVGLDAGKTISHAAVDALHLSGNHDPSREQVDAETAHWLFDKDGKPISLEEAKRLPVGFKFGRK